MDCVRPRWFVGGFESFDPTLACSLIAAHRCLPTCFQSLPSSVSSTKPTEPIRFALTLYLTPRISKLIWSSRQNEADKEEAPAEARKDDSA